MKRIYEMPPLLSGSEDQQLRQLRDYLARLVLALNEQQEERE